MISSLETKVYRIGKLSNQMRGFQDFNVVKNIIKVIVMRGADSLC